MKYQLLAIFPQAAAQNQVVLWSTSLEPISPIWVTLVNSTANSQQLTFQFLLRRCQVSSSIHLQSCVHHQEDGAKETQLNFKWHSMEETMTTITLHLLSSQWPEHSQEVDLLMALVEISLSMDLDLEMTLNLFASLTIQYSLHLPLHGSKSDALFLRQAKVINTLVMLHFQWLLTAKIGTISLEDSNSTLNQL